MTKKRSVSSNLTDTAGLDVPGSPNSAPAKREISFLEYLRAGYPCFWVETHEEDRAISQLSLEANNGGKYGNYQIYGWDLVSGLSDHLGSQPRPMPDPLRAIQSAASLPERSILFLKDFHRFINSIEVIRTIKNLLPVLKASCRYVAFVSPVVSIPVELSKDITVLHFQLPSHEELESLAKDLATGAELGDLPTEAIISAKGLTMTEAENAIALSLIKEKAISRRVLEREKLQAVKKSGLMELYEAIPESELGGLENLKKYIHNRKKGFTTANLPTPKGILLVGLPGGGKSLSAKVIASVLDFPLLRLDLAALKGSHVGESEQHMRQALNLIDAIAPVVVWLDELEKVLSGVQSSGKTDGGATSNMFSQLLTWMQESTSPRYIIATCNDIGDLLAISQGALLRRFDDVFFVDMPSEKERAEILAIMNARYSMQVSAAWVSRMESWTGAEIEKFVVASVYDGEEEAFGNIKPIFHQNRELIESARNWAKYNARLANFNPQSEERTMRRIAV